MNIKKYFTLKSYLTFLTLALISLFLYMFDSMISSGLAWKENKEEFIEACDFEDGITFQSTTGMGKPQLTCVYRGIIIDVNPALTLLDKQAKLEDDKLRESSKK